MADASPAFFASELLRIKAVSLSPQKPFTWASGLRSPIYCDNRMTMGHPALRTAIAKAFAAHIEAVGWEADVIAGTATAGIPHAAWLAQVCNMPMAYVRSKAKAHGRQNQIEGPLSAGQRVVLVEDLISTGMSSMAAVDGLVEAEAKVAGVVAIFSYGFPSAHARFASAGIPLHTLTSFDTLVKVAQKNGLIEAADLDTLKAWQADPKVWSDRQEA